MKILSAAQKSTKWLELCESKIGKSHIMRGKPNQDANKCRHLDRGRAGLIVVVSDGHGGDRYVRSKHGASMAASITCRYLKERLAPYWDMPSAAVRVSLTELQEEVPRYLLRQWRSTVREHMATEPWTDQEKQFGWGNGPVEDAYTAYGATLLFAAALPEFILYGQLGDGDMLTVARNGAIARPIARSESSFANETLSLCSRSAEANMTLAMQRYGAGSLKPEDLPPDMVFLATDGYSNSFQNEEGFIENVAGIHDYLRSSNGYSSVKRSLPHWVENCAQSGSGDDVTVALLFPESLISRTSS